MEFISYKVRVIREENKERFFNGIIYSFYRIGIILRRANA